VTFRARVALLAAAAVSVAVVIASVLVYVLVRSELRGQLDDALRERAAQVRVLPPGAVPEFTVADPRLGGAAGYVQLVPERGPPVRAPGATVTLPSAGARAVAAGMRDDFYEDAVVAGARVRLLTTRVGPGLALQIARPLDEVDVALHRLALLLALISVGGVGVAGAAGLAVARGALRPLRRLTEATEHVARTRDLSRRIPASRPDELGRVATSFNAMLGALERSLAAQRRLVDDASHELRTPLTSLRTNVQLLARVDLPADERRAVLADLDAELAELTKLVAELVELARGEERPSDREPIQFDALVAAVVERARRHASHVRLRTRLEPSLVEAVPEQIERAVANLVDNAVKWSPQGGSVRVCVRGGEVSVRDRGPGIAEADLPHVFERFYRAPSARAVPGSGLGLTIVREVAERHGGSVRAENARGGGARFRLKLLPLS
jgi:two-component system sensor histidine kinase MprB